MKNVAELAATLIARASVTPEDAGCQELLGSRLAASGFELHNLPCGEVSNLWARRGQEAPLLCFAGHTDVVPPGPLSAWRTPPFSPIVQNGMLFGRGAADMKGALAAIIIAIERFVSEQPDHAGSLAVLLTSDEEGPAIDGTRAVMEILGQRKQRIDYCIVGEPSAVARSGDRLRIGRRGSLNASLAIHGAQGHVAYPEAGKNPIHAALPALDAIARQRWDEGTDAFPPTHLQFTDLQSGVGASNVTPATLTTRFNLRFSPAINALEIELRLREILDSHALEYDLECTVSGEPFYTKPGKLRATVQEAVHTITGQPAEESTGGGTSDGRFIAMAGTEVVEIGPPGLTLHKANEQVEVAELERLAEIYLELMRRLLGQN